MIDGLRQRVVNYIAGDVISKRVAEVEAKFAEELASVAAAPITHDVDGWQALIREVETEDRLFVEWKEDVEEALNAWRKSFLVRQIVRLTTNYVVGDGIGLSSELVSVEKFIRQWWDHPMNRMDLRLPTMCDELTRSGELFVVLFTNEFDGMTYIRFIPAKQIDKVETNPEDLEDEWAYHRQGTLKNVQGKWWKSARVAKPGDPVVLHYAINRPVGAVRGEGDLVPILPWAKRYTAWLKDRVRLNRARVEGGLWDVTIEDSTKVDAKNKQYGKSPPEHGSVIVHDKGEIWDAKSLNINSADAKDDGKVLRLAVATGAGIPLHFMSEGESATKATAAFMGGPTFRHYRQRQKYFGWMLKDIIGHAYRLSGKREYIALRLKVTVPDIEVRDNRLMAQSAKLIVDALVSMRAQGWVTDEMAVRMAFQFAGEILTEDDIKLLLEKTKVWPPVVEGEEDE